MKNYLISIIMVILFLCVGCTKQHTSTTPKDAKVTAECLKTCKKHYGACERTCDNDCRTCQKEAYEEAKKDYLRYQSQVSVMGEYNIRQIGSYRDPLMCSKSSCNCRADKSACEQACHGKISKYLRIAPRCY